MVKHVSNDSSVNLLNMWWVWVTPCWQNGLECKDHTAWNISPEAYCPVRDAKPSIRNRQWTKREGNNSPVHSKSHHRAGKELIAEWEIAVEGGLREEEVILYRAGKMEEMKRRRQPFRVGQVVLTGNEEAVSAHRWTGKLKAELWTLPLRMLDLNLQTRQ